MTKLMIILSMLALAGCVNYAEQDSARCVEFGAAPGTDAYTSCRVQLQAAHMNADGAILAANLRNNSGR